MPTFILRNLDPTFWTRVKAKATADGVTVKAVILRLLTAWLGVLLLLLSVGCAAESPTKPSVIPFDERAPTSLQIDAIAGTGSHGGTAHLTVKAQNGHGEKIAGVRVQFTTDLGSLSASAADTQADGIASVTLTASGAATVIARAGTVTAKMLVPSLPNTPDPGPIAPGDPPPAPHDPSPVPLTVTLLVTPAPAGSATLFFLQAPGISRAVWTFGDGASVTTTAPTSSHVYAAARAYTASVTITDPIGRTASNSQTFTVPEPPAPPGPSYTVSLSASPAAVLIGQSTTLTATVTPEHGAPPPTSFAWTFGDGASATTTTASTTHAYATAGTKSASVTATGGTATGSGSTIVTVSAAVPVVTVNCSTGVHVGSSSQCVVSATLNGATVPSAQITHVDWDFGDGSTASTSSNVSPPHAYSTSATYTVQAIATVTGGTGPGTGTTTTTILP